MNSSRAYSTGAVYILFIFTGVAVVLPGALLPVFLLKYSLRDGQGGVLLFASFVGSALGALASRGRLPYSMARGAALTAIGATCLGYASSVPILFGAMFVFGMGLGIAMTSASLLQARNHAADRSAELTRMNLLWSLGATAGPWIGLRGANRLGLSYALIAVAGIALLTGTLSAFANEAGVDGVNEFNKVVFSKRTAFLLLLAIPLATGIEAAVGGWLTTYAERLRETLTFTVRAGTCFWAGMLISRFAQSFPSVATWSKRVLLLLGPAFMIFGFLLLLFAGGAFVSIGALMLGLGAGPMYPLLLAFSLSSGERSNVAFVSAGCGASLLPFLTGQISGNFGGLRKGLAVPLVAAVIMFLSNAAISRDLTRRS